MSKRILAFFSVSILVLSVLPLKLTTQADATGANPPPAADNIVYHGLTRLYTNFYNGVNGVVYDISKANAFNPTIRAGYYATFDVTVSDVDVPNGVNDNNSEQLVNSILKINNSSDSYNQLGSFAFTKTNRHANSKVSMKRVDNGTGTAGNKGTYRITFENVQYNGSGSDLSVPLYDASGNLQESRTVQVPGTYSKLDSPNDTLPPEQGGDGSTQIDIETPYVIVHSYGFGKETVKAGDTFPLTIVFKNTSDYTDITNMLLTIKPAEGLKITNSSNTIHIPSISAQDVVTKIINITADHAATAKSYDIELELDYQYLANLKRTNFKRTNTISIPVVSNDRFELTSVEVPPTSSMDEEITVTLNYVNKGRSEIYNLTADILGNFKNPGQKTNIGNLAAGAKGTVDFYINPSEVGNLAGEVRMTYEDSNAVSRTQSLMFSTEVKDGAGSNIDNGMMDFPMGEGDMGMPEMPPEPQTNYSAIIWTAVGVVVAIVGTILTVKRIKKNRREWEDADL